LGRQVTDVAVPVEQARFFAANLAVPQKLHLLPPTLLALFWNRSGRISTTPKARSLVSRATDICATQLPDLSTGGQDATVCSVWGARCDHAIAVFADESQRC